MTKKPSSNILKIRRLEYQITCFLRVIKRLSADPAKRIYYSNVIERRREVIEFLRTSESSHSWKELEKKFCFKYDCNCE